MCVLTAIRVPSSIRRTDQTRRMHLPPVQVLIFELAAVDAGCAGTVAIIDVSALDHELINDSVEGCFSITQAIVLAGA